MKQFKSFLIYFILTLFIFNGTKIALNGQISSNVDSAWRHLKSEYDKCHIETFVYKNDNSGCNNFIPSIWQGGVTDIEITQADTTNPFAGRSNLNIKFPLGSTLLNFSAIRFVYPDNNIGTSPGFNVSGASKLSLFARGKGTVEFQVGGMNRKPFHNPGLFYQDGVDLRGTGLINLSPVWTNIQLDLLDSTFWVYKDSLAGVNNKYPEPLFMGNFSKMKFRYGANNGMGGTCLGIFWTGNNAIEWAGLFMAPPEGCFLCTSGYDLSGLTRIRFKARNTANGPVKILFGKQGDSCGLLDTTITFPATWQWYDWIVPTGLNYSNVAGGIGFVVGGSTGTPTLSFTYIDSIYYEGVNLASDYSNLISGFAVSASTFQNSDTVQILVDEVFFNKDRRNSPRLCQSFVAYNDSIDVTQKNSAHVYDQSLKIISEVALSCRTGDPKYLNDAIKTGKALLFAIENDRYFGDKRLRNVYMNGEIKHFDGTARMAGWWDEDSLAWYEDPYFVGTAVGNVTWAGISLLTLYEASGDSSFLITAKSLADWCFLNTWTNNGFTGGVENWEPIQDTATYKSTEHNIDCFVLFSRLFSFYGDSTYFYAAQNARSFVIDSMWNPISKQFYTGTLSDGITTNTSVIPLDIQNWYVLGFKDNSSTYTQCMDWARQNCYLTGFNSPNYAMSLYGFDFNPDKDGIWSEGTAQAALAYKFLGNFSFADSLTGILEMMQFNNPLGNNKGIPAADHNNLTTGFDWEYHNRLGIGPTCWYILAALNFNPYYFEDCDSIQDNIFPPHNNSPSFDFIVYPNPADHLVTFAFKLDRISKTTIKVYDYLGRNIANLIEEELPEGPHDFTWNTIGKKGLYICVLEVGNLRFSKNFLIP